MAYDTCEVLFRLCLTHPLPTQMQGQSTPAPFRGTKKGAEDVGEEPDEQQEEEGGAVDIMDLLPRTDIR